MPRKYSKASDRLYEILNDTHAEQCEGWSDPKCAIIKAYQLAVWEAFCGKPFAKREQK